MGNLLIGFLIDTITMNFLSNQSTSYNRCTLAREGILVNKTNAMHVDGIYYYMEKILAYIHASAAYRQGIFGQGILVAVLDTGIYPHSDLQGRIRGFRDYIRQRQQPYDDNGHGTHISGIIGAGGKEPFTVWPRAVICRDIKYWIRMGMEKFWIFVRRLKIL